MGDTGEGLREGFLEWVLTLLAWQGQAGPAWAEVGSRQGHRAEVLSFKESGVREGQLVLTMCGSNPAGPRDSHSGAGHLPPGQEGSPKAFELSGGPQGHLCILER